jgi:hypothetical protein
MYIMEFEVEITLGFSSHKSASKKRLTFWGHIIFILLFLNLFVSQLEVSLIKSARSFLNFCKEGRCVYIICPAS